ncbi:sensor histidine kinase [Amorphoplanes nipponensis]|uniref:histidine kinase n=1 Tax=Actinoplanes nipponensis TaxID=135950 RepID=A0A919JBM2_9ACTN|nr:sensor histidine kinase [Actinoplanes nipponensis]GIE46853.1 two-component sensor histidine kinase [Actinoplanes nipponensis]
MRWIRSSAADLALAALLAASAAAGSAVADGLGRPSVPLGTPGYVLVVVAALGLSARRSRPLVALTTAAVCAGGYLALGYAYGPVILVLMIAVYSAARHAPPPAAAWCAAATLMLLLVHLLTSDRALGWLGVVPVAAWVVVPGALGYGLRLRQQAGQQARAEAIRQRLDEERLRVAQEVHDVVGHGLAAIKMQADIALHVMPRQPDQARVALAAISRTSRQALDELRTTLAAVRHVDGDDRAPAAGLGRLNDLRRRMADAGVTVRVRTTGERPGALPPAVDLAGYRIVQESLTNVLRHGRCERADVTVRYTTDDVTITIANPINGTPANGDGTGIRGMRARVEALGGDFVAGPVAQRFEVRARLPAGGGA